MFGTNKEQKPTGEAKEVFHFQPQAKTKLQVFKNEQAGIGGICYSLSVFCNSTERSVTDMKVVIKPNGDTLTYVWYVINEKE